MRPLGGFTSSEVYRFILELCAYLGITSLRCSSSINRGHIILHVNRAWLELQAELRSWMPTSMYVEVLPEDPREQLPPQVAIKQQAKGSSMPRPWDRLTFTSGVELLADDEGITIITGGGSMRLTNRQLIHIGDKVREHLEHFEREEVNVNSREFRRKYYGVP